MAEPHDIAADGAHSKAHREASESPRRVDVSALRCPMTWVRTKLALEELPPGGPLEVMLSDGEMLCNVPRNVAEAGHAVQSLTEVAPGLHLLSVLRRPEPR